MTQGGVAVNAIPHDRVVDFETRSMRLAGANRWSKAAFATESAHFVDILRRPAAVEVSDPRGQSRAAPALKGPPDADLALRLVSKG